MTHPLRSFSFAWLSCALLVSGALACGGSNDLPSVGGTAGVHPEFTLDFSLTVGSATQKLSMKALPNAVVADDNPCAWISQNGDGYAGSSAFPYPFVSGSEAGHSDVEIDFSTDVAFTGPGSYPASIFRMGIDDALCPYAPTGTITVATGGNGSLTFSGEADQQDPPTPCSGTVSWTCANVPN